MTSERLVALVLLVAAWWIVGVVAPQQARGQEVVTVHLVGQPPFAAQLDTRTDHNRLWFRVERTGISLWRSAAWSELDHIESRTATISGADFHRGYLAWLAANPPVTAAAPVATSHRAQPPAKYAGFRPLDEPVPADIAPRAVAERVSSIRIDAQGANWDADAEWDGVLVYLECFDTAGRPIAANGTVSFDLIGFMPGYLHQDPQALLPHWGHWTRQASPDQFNLRGLPLRLEFQAFDPERSTGLSSAASLHARLVVPGQGVFSAVVDFVRVRRFSPQRDRLQMLTGSRQLPFEQ